MFGYLHLCEGGEGLGQDVVGPGLGGHRLTDDHDTVSHVEHRLQLADLLDEPVSRLQVVLLTKFLKFIP